MGNRVGDPHSATLSTFARTDKGWPELMRVFPILDWTYGDVWSYLDGKDYCSLYDEVRKFCVVLRVKKRFG